MRFDRLSQMENYILDKQHVLLTHLAHVFRVSLNTVRRDVTILEERGNITRIRGGVISRNQPQLQLGSSSLSQGSFYVDPYQEPKNRIGELAAHLVEDNQTLFIDSGTTTKNMVPYLHDKKGITIITSSPRVLIEAIKLSKCTLIVLGGEYSQRSDTFHSYQSIEELAKFNIDIAFLGATGISVQNGLTTATYMESHFKRSAMLRAKTAVVMVDSRKFYACSSSKFADLSEVAYLVSDNSCPHEVELFCNSNGIKCLFSNRKNNEPVYESLS